jgi:glycogen debranching enzyme
MLCLLLVAPQQALARAQTGASDPAARLTPKFAREASGPELERPAQAGAFLGITGRRSAALGYERAGFEVWTYPLQVLDRFQLSFRLEGYPLGFSGADTLSLVNVRPEATTLTYTHAAFNVRQHIYAPISEPGVLMLLEVDSTLPLTIEVSFRPRLRLMWPAGLMTGNAGWDEDERAYFIGEETGRFVGVVGSPIASAPREMPYQEEPRDVSAGFSLEVPAEQLRGNYIPVVIAGGARGRTEARETYRRLLARAPALYRENVAHYRRLLTETTEVFTPDVRINEALRWAKVGVEKGLVENPSLGTGLVAGYRTAGESERPGFAWFFGRDALWTAFALNSYGDFATTRAALDFLAKYQRADGKIPHEISQSAAYLRWFEDYPYPWASADATPLYLIVHADLLRASGDSGYTRASWASLQKAYRFAAATDADRDGLIENTGAGHGWVEGGALYPPHEEIYLQGIWAEAQRALGEMAEALGDEKTAVEAQAGAERTRAAIEETYWLEERGFYAFATNQPRERGRKAEPGPNRAMRQERMNELDRASLIDEETIMPAVPLWWRVLDDERAQAQLNSIGGARLATDWGARLISDSSRLYDPLSYHHGSVWPLFTGWTSVGAYAYGRPHIGFQALMANVLLHRQNALGYVTELLSGEFNAPFGRSSHHQIWSEAMTAAPLLRGLLGLEAQANGRGVSFAPQVPADWDSVEVRNLRLGDSHFDLALRRGGGRMSIGINRRRDGEGRNHGNAGERVPTAFSITPAFPLDARVERVRVNGRSVQFTSERRGDVQFVGTEIEVERQAEVLFEYVEGSDVYVTHEAPRPGDRSAGLRVLRAHAEADGLRLLLEGAGGHTYTLGLRSPRTVGDAPGVNEVRRPGQDTRLIFVFNAPGRHVRHEYFIPLGEAREARTENRRGANQ